MWHHLEKTINTCHRLGLMQDWQWQSSPQNRNGTSKPLSLFASLHSPTSRLSSWQTGCPSSDKGHCLPVCGPMGLSQQPVLPREVSFAFQIMCQEPFNFSFWIECIQIIKISILFRNTGKWSPTGRSCEGPYQGQGRWWEPGIKRLVDFKNHHPFN